MGTATDMRIHSKKLTYIIVASIMLAICLLSFYSPTLRSFLHEIINIFAGGRSNIKIYLFFIYTAFILLLNLDFSKKTDDKFKINYKSIIAWVSGISAYNLALYLVFIHRFGFGLKDFVLSVNNSEVSSTKLLHIHVAKGAMGLLLGLFHLSHQENLDTGLAYVNLLPQPLYWIVLLMLAMSIAIFAVYYKQNLANSKLRNIWVSFLYSIVTFSILKNFIDGGLFNRETLVAIAGLLLITLPQAKRKLAAIPLVLYALTLIISMRVDLIRGPEARYDLLLSIIFFTFIATLWYWFKNKKVDSFGIWLLALSLVWLAVPTYFFINSYASLHKPVLADGSYVGLYKTDSSLGEPVEKIGDLNIYEVHQQYKNQQEIINQYHLLDNLDPIRSKWENCLPDNRREKMVFDLITKDPVNIQLTKYKFGNITQFNGSNGRYHLTISLDSCAPRPLNIIQEILNTQISQPYFLVNLRGSTDELE